MLNEYKQKWNGSLTYEKVIRYVPHFKSAIQLINLNNCLKFVLIFCVFYLVRDFPILQLKESYP